MPSLRRALHGGIALVLGAALGGPGATSARAAPVFGCDASALRASVGGLPAIEPVTQGRGIACATGSALPAVTLPPLLSVDRLIADTTFDGTGAATGGLTHLQVLPTPDLIKQLPTMTAIAALPDQTVTVPEPLATTLKLAGLSPDVAVDVKDAVRALVPDPTAAILSADVLTARAAVACQAGVPQLGGSSDIAGVRLGGLEVALGGAVSQAVTLIGARSVAGSSLDPAKVHIVTDLGSLLGDVQAILGTLLPQIGPLPLPASAVDVALTPNAQTRDAGSLTQQALHATIALGAQPVLDAVLGEAHVSAADGTCAPPAPPVAPGTPAAPVAPQGSVADQILACTDRKLVLVDVLRQGRRVKLLGAANRDYVGRQVAIRLRATGRIVAHATVRPDGSFVTYAPAPPRALLATHARANTVRYRAEIGREVSLPLKLQRRMIVSSLVSRDGKVIISGRVVPPLTTPRAEIRVIRRVSCHRSALVGRFTPRADGRFRITVPAPAGQTAAIYRLATRVREKPGNPRTYPTFTLPRGVALETR